MALSFGQSGFAGGSTTSGAPAEAGPDLGDYQSPQIGFQGLNKEYKVKLFPKSWPEDSPPAPTSSLLSICQKHGLLAAGGPETVVIAKTKKIREALYSASGDNLYTSVEPDLTLPLRSRIAHVAFSSDGSYLAASAEQGGGLAVFGVEQLLEGNTNSIWETPTNNMALRALVANPAPESAELFAAVTANGELFVADVKAKEFKQSVAGGLFYKSGVSCVAWSIKGKAMLAGLADGTVSQIRADGELMLEIPRPPDLPSEYHVAAIDWLSLHVAIIAYSPDNTAPGYPDPTHFYLLERIVLTPKAAPSSHRFSKFPEVGIINQPRLPNAASMSAISQYHNLEQLVIVVQSGSEDICTLVKSKTPLETPLDGQGPSNVFAMIAPVEDGRKASLPLKQDQSDSTTPVGMALDLSSTEIVPRPIPFEDRVDESPGPLPSLMVLNSEGVLSAWWLVYADAIVNGITYPGMVSEQAAAKPASSTTTASGAAATASPFASSGAKFGQSSTPQFGASGFAATATPGSAGSAFGQTSSLGVGKPAFGASGFQSAQQSAGSSSTGLGAGAATFGSASKLGQSQSPFTQAAGTPGKTSAFGASSFGSTSTLGSGTASPWAQNATGASAKPFGSQSQFGQPATTKSTFGTPASTTSGTPAFGTSGFGTTKPADNDSGQNANPFAKPGDTPSPFAAAANKSTSGAFGSGGTFGQGGQLGQSRSLWGQPDDKPKPNPFANTKFGLQSSFVDQASTTADSTVPKSETGTSLFGAGFQAALTTASESVPRDDIQDHEEDMEDDTSPNIPESPEIAQSTTPQETPAAQKVMGAPPAKGGMFGSKTTSLDGPAAAPSSLGVPPVTFPKSPDATPKASSAQDTKSEEKRSAERGVPLPPDTRSVAESAPLPPDPAKFKPKVSADDFPPLPPDFTKSTGNPPSAAVEPMKPPPQPVSKSPSFNPFASPAAKAKGAQSEQAAPLPPDDASPIDDEGSGVDVANELSIEGSPESSFVSKSSSASMFVGKGSGSFKQPPKSVRSVFDDVAKPHVDFFKQPTPSDVPDSPRSPSPVRQPKAAPFNRPPPPTASTASRSISGPAVPKNPQGQRKVTLGRPQPPPQKVVSPIASAVKKGVEEEKRAAEAKAQALREAEEQELSDREDEYIRAELEAPIEPTITLSSFIAHQDYVGEVSKEGIPGQIEIVYRDANSMVDTLGLNLRSVQSWVAGHSKPGVGKGRRQISDLDTTDGWTLADIEHLEHLQEDLQSQLEATHVSDIVEKLQTCRDVSAELHKLKKRSDDVAKTLENLRRQEDGPGGDDHAPLSAAQSEAQQDLRRSFAEFRSNLSVAEEGVALLKAKLVSHNKGGSSGVAQKAPTVEAVQRTINKMTAMIEKKSGDLDILGARLQKLGLVERPSSSRGLLQGRSSRSSSSFETPVQSRPGSSAKHASPLRASLNGKAAFTPRGSKLGNSLLADSMTNLALGSNGGAQSLTDQELEQYTEKLKHRKEVNTILKRTLGSGQVRVRPLDD